LQHRFFQAQIRHEPLLFRVLLLALAQPFISEGSNPSYFLRQGRNVALLMALLRYISPINVASSACFNMKAICASQIL
jgi:hypothetical protein